jgi:hypothetical protein
MKSFFAFFLFCFSQCYAMNAESSLDVLGKSRPDTVRMNDIIVPKYANHVSMLLFHEAYVLFCSQHLGGDMFFSDFGEYDPANPENGNKDLKTRYTEWAAANGKAIPNNGDPLI